tara:strand:- start:10126 stop:10605 length:480 start_codon:yes stop_codon:yes gene_type:complete
VIRDILKVRVGLLIIISILVFTACESSTESTPESAMISGTVNFSGEWPSGGNVFISLQASWPPTGGGAPYGVIQVSGPLESFEYDFEDVAFGTYGAITVSWLDPNDQNPATNQHVIGAYGGSIQAGFMDATTMTFSEDDHELKDANITANFSFIKVGPS